MIKIGQDGEVSWFQPVLHQMHPLLGLERVSDDDQGPPKAILKPFLTSCYGLVHYFFC